MSQTFGIAASDQAAYGLQPEVIAALNELTAGMRFGSIEIVVHEGRITQIERREKLRLVQRSAPPRG